MELYADSAYKLAVYHIMRSATHADARVTVFIDYNNNLVYDIPQERVFTGTADISNYYLYTYIRTPFFPAINTPTGMREVFNNNVSPNTASDTGVGLYTSGETEDYLVRFRLKQIVPTELEEVFDIQQIAVYPNPSNGKVFVGFNAKEQTSIRLTVMNMTGSTVLEKEYKNIFGGFVSELDLASQAKGCYLIKINSKQGSFVRKVVLD